MGRFRLSGSQPGGTRDEGSRFDLRENHHMSLENHPTGSGALPTGAATEVTLALIEGSVATEVT